MMSYQPIENYGIIATCATVALVGMTGSIDRNCYPQFYRRTKKLMQEREDLPSQLIRTLAATQRREVPSPVRALNELRKYCTQ
jgi:hypothetical protein